MSNNTWILKDLSSLYCKNIIILTTSILVSPITRTGLETLHPSPPLIAVVEHVYLGVSDKA